MRRDAYFGAYPFPKRRTALENENQFTLSQLRYIISLFRLSRDGCGVKNSELASALGISKPSVHNMLKFLIELGVVKQESFGLAYLTEEGRELAHKYTACYEIIENRIAEVCGSGAVSENAICGILADIPPEKIDELYHSKK